RAHNVFDYLSWLEPFDGDHPVEIQQMWQDVQSGQVNQTIRPDHDVKRLLNNPFYQIGRAALKVWSFLTMALR
ncbi:MAG: hypothetical protein AAGD96_35000, partial [Chloroflexota bacterium]